MKPEDKKIYVELCHNTLWGKIKYWLFKNLGYEKRTFYGESMVVYDNFTNKYVMLVQVTDEVSGNVYHLPAPKAKYGTAYKISLLLNNTYDIFLFKEVPPRLPEKTTNLRIVKDKENV